ncbi:MAG: bifunctional diaminohydroxyphosphoribosylaminopyrimidine deaminase/5-amino-6-(5-phosphoribosylamino)uracil reductase RibD [Betaproteobacteria bacterium]|nr:bifunctional diaminohydroxyphosphoribosylaminopyrimidine deaminase/5-amino-6-(5-phosphoribosylamino)uracil reductase RibD [Betaproteobacteria bacterium]
MYSSADYGYMARALGLARRGLYTTSPNPRVGCVVVQDGQIVGEGWHERAGEPHAEIHALRAAGSRAHGATVYVTLEPCNHFGRTPPCSEALVAAQVGRVVAAMQDPNPQVAGAGLARLRAAGIPTQCGLLEEEARLLNLGFISRVTRGRPWVVLKSAASLDGRTALKNGKSFWITGEAARRDAHRLRARSCAVATGIGTVLADDPRLDVREVETARQPLKVVFDSRLRTPPSARILQGAPTVLIGAQANREAQARLEDAGAEVLIIPGRGPCVDIPEALGVLAGRGINELMVEAGAQLLGAFLAAGAADEWVAYLAPALLGDDGRGMFAIPELTDLKERRPLEIREIRTVGRDVRVRARFV